MRNVCRVAILNAAGAIAMNTYTGKDADRKRMIFLAFMDVSYVMTGLTVNQTLSRRALKGL